MLVKPKPFPLPPRLARSPLVQNPLTVLAINWLCQGMRGMGRRERRARLVQEGLVAALLAAVGTPLLGWPWALATACLVAHTLAWTLNGQFWVVLRYLPAVRREPEALMAFLADLRRRLEASSFLREAVLTGSLAERGRAGPHTDIDLRLVYPAGIRARLATDLLVLRLRAAAFWRAIPLDLYVEDRVEDLARLNPRVPWRLLLDRDGRIRRRFATSRRISGP